MARRIAALGVAFALSAGVGACASRSGSTELEPEPIGPYTFTRCEWARTDDRLRWTVDVRRHDPVVRPAEAARIGYVLHLFDRRGEVAGTVFLGRTPPTQGTSLVRWQGEKVGSLAQLDVRRCRVVEFGK